MYQPIIETLQNTNDPTEKLELIIDEEIAEQMIDRCKKAEKVPGYGIVQCFDLMPELFLNDKYVEYDPDTLDAVLFTIFYPEMTVTLDVYFTSGKCFSGDTIIPIIGSHFNILDYPLPQDLQ